MKGRMRRYCGAGYWWYKVPGRSGDPARVGWVELPTPTSNFGEDEGHARYLVRKKLGLRRLPAGSTVRPQE